MRQIRRNVFETNSSSTHSITICTSDEYSRWHDGELYLNDSYGSTSKYANKNFLTREEAYDVLTNKGREKYKHLRIEDMDDDILNSVDIKTWGHYWDEAEHFNEYYEDYTTPNGDEIVAFGYYGHD